MPRGPRRDKETPAVIHTISCHPTGGGTGAEARTRNTQPARSRLRRRTARPQAPAPSTDSIFNNLLARAEQCAANPEPFIDRERRVLERFQDSVVHEGMRVRCSFDVPYHVKPAEEEEVKKKKATSTTANTGKTDKKRPVVCSKWEHSERNRRLQFDAANPRRSSAAQTLANIRTGLRLDAVADSKYFRCALAEVPRNKAQQYRSDDEEDGTPTRRRKSARVRNARAAAQAQAQSQSQITSQHTSRAKQKLDVPLVNSQPRTTRNTTSAASASAQDNEDEDEDASDVEENPDENETSGNTQRMEAASDSTVVESASACVFIEEDVLDAGDEFSTPVKPPSPKRERRRERDRSRSRKRRAPYAKDDEWAPAAARRRTRRRIVEDSSSSEDELVEFQESNADDDVDADLDNKYQSNAADNRQRRKAARDALVRLSQPHTQPSQPQPSRSQRPVHRVAAQAMPTMTPDRVNSDDSDLDAVNHLMTDEEEEDADVDMDGDVQLQLQPPEPQRPPASATPSIHALAQGLPVVLAILPPTTNPLYPVSVPIRLSLHAAAHARAQARARAEARLPAPTPAPRPVHQQPAVTTAPFRMRLQLHQRPKQAKHGERPKHAKHGKFSPRAHYILESAADSAPAVFRCQLCGRSERAKHAILVHLRDVHRIKCDQVRCLVRPPQPPPEPTPALP